MESTIAIIAIVLLAVTAVTGLVCLSTILILHQKYTNEVNKRLSLMASEAIEKERVTMQEYQEALQQLDVQQMVQDTRETKEEEAFNPHNYNPLDIPVEEDDDE